MAIGDWLAKIFSPKTSGETAPAPTVAPTIPPQETNYFIDNQPVNNNIPSLAPQDNEQALALLNQEQDMQFDYEQYVIDQLQEELDIAKEELQEQEDEDGFVNDIFNGLKELTGLGVSKSEVKDAIEKQEEIINLLIEAKRTGNFERVYEQITGNKYDEQKLIECHNTETVLEAMEADLTTILNGAETDEVKQGYINQYLLAFQNETGISYEDLTNQYKELSEQYLGSSNELTNVLNKYTQSQDGFIDKAANVAQIGGIGMMIVGGIACFIPGGQLIGAGMMKAGQMLSLGGMFGDNILDVADNITNQKGFNEEKDEYGAILRETALEGVSYLSGRLIGGGLNGLKLGSSSATGALGELLNKGTNGLNDYVASKFGSKILGQVAETTLDAALSLGADYVIAQGDSLISNGEFLDNSEYWSADRFLGEGKNQLLGILTGLAHSKINGMGAGSLKINTPALEAEALAFATPKAEVPKLEAPVIDAQTPKMTFNPETGELAPVKPQGEVETITLDHPVAGDNIGVGFSDRVINQTKTEKNIYKLLKDATIGTEAEEYLSKRDYQNLEKAINCTHERLTTQKGVKVSKESLIEVVKAMDFPSDASTLITTASSKSADFGKLYVLSKLINSGVVTEKSLEKVGAFCVSKVGYINQTIESPRYFNEVLRNAGINSETIKFYESISANIKNGVLSSQSADLIMENKTILNLVEGDRFTKESSLFPEGVDSDMPEILARLEQFVVNHNDGENKFNLINLQNDAGVVVQAVSRTQDDGGVVEYIQESNLKNGNERSAKTLTYKMGNQPITAWNKDSDREVEILLKISQETGLNEIVSQMEIIKNSNGEPTQIIYTKRSDRLDGVYETTKYQLSDYPEDMDVVKAIKNGTIQGGEKLSYITENLDGSITYSEKYAQNSCLTKRNYTQQLDENGKIIKIEYSYNIVGTNGASMLLNRSFVVNPDGSTTTKINDKTYSATFDDDLKIITIADNDGNKTQIDIAKKIDIEYQSFENQEALWQFFKENPADNLLRLEKIPYIIKCDSIDASVNTDYGILSIGTDEIATVAHELGHVIDFVDQARYSKNPELIEIYNKEFESFKQQYPLEAEKIIKYFSQHGGGTSDIGLNEFIAETNAILTTYGNANILESRAMYLSRYFPNTIAKIGELTYADTIKPVLDTDFSSVDYKNLTPEQIVQINKTAIELASTYNREIQGIEDLFNNIFDSANTLSARGKSPKSILEKLIAKQADGKLGEISTQEAAKLIGDGYGVRVQMPSLTQAQTDSIIQECLAGTGKTQAQFQKLIDDGKFDELLADDDFRTTFEILKETRSQGVVDSIVKAITSKQIVPANGEDDYFNNYGSEITSYLTNAQLLQIDAAYFETYGQHLSFVNKTPVEIPNSSLEMSPEHATSKTNTKKAQKPSGYTDTQFNITTNHTDKNNPLGDMELQLRGVEVHKVAEVEHIPYDIRQGKITVSNPKYSQYYELLKGMSPESYKKYNAYLSATYTWAILKELNLTTDAQKPKLEIELSFGDAEYLQKAGLDVSLAGRKLTPEELERITIEGLEKYKVK